MTKEPLAKAVGLSVRYVQGLEAGEHFPVLPTLLGLGQRLSAFWNEMFASCE